MIKMKNNKKKFNINKAVDSTVDFLTKDIPENKIVIPKNIEFITTVVSILIFFALFMLLLKLTFNGNEENIPKSYHSYPQLSIEEYKNIVNEYGDKATLLVKDYMLNNNNSIPNFDDIASDIIIDDYHVSCRDRIINRDGSIYLSDCFIRGYYGNYDYQYGSIKD
ncbi:MAG: hypothetical protein Q4E69_07355 [Bacilli bacterium]|nr:hypothetical protein [Bacilli bacterium]